MAATVVAGMVVTVATGTETIAVATADAITGTVGVVMMGVAGIGSLHLSHYNKAAHQAPFFFRLE
jgi:hypothetical protein